MTQYIDVMSEQILPKKIKISDSVLFQEIDNEYVLLNMKTELYFGLNDIGAKVWQIISQEGTTDTLIEKIMSEYDVPADTLRTDISQLLNELKKEQLISIEA